MEQTLVLVKPDGMDNIEYIIEQFYQNGLKIENFRVLEMDDELVAEHYAHLTEFPFYPTLVEFMESAPIAALILTGENAVAKVREVIGCTNSLEAAEGTIRQRFGTDKTRNAVHASDSVENAQIEIERFFNRGPKLN